MRKGFIKWFDHRKGYGFIRYFGENEELREMFVHKSNLTSLVTEGTKVSFNIEETPKGAQAIEVKKIKEL